MPGALEHDDRCARFAQRLDARACRLVDVQQVLQHHEFGRRHEPLPQIGGVVIAHRNARGMRFVPLFNHSPRVELRQSRARPIDRFLVEDKCNFWNRWFWCFFRDV